MLPFLLLSYVMMGVYADYGRHDDRHVEPAYKRNANPRTSTAGHVSFTVSCTL